MRTYDLIQPKSNDLDRNLIIRATRGAHPMAVRTDKARKRPHSLVVDNRAKFCQIQ